MSTTIFTARDYDPAKARRKRRIVIGVLCVVVIAVSLYFVFRNWPYEHRVDQFFAAVQQKDYNKAYGIWFNDPNWQQHPDAHKQYPYNEFYRDWGPGGDWGLINSYKIVGSARPPHGGSGIIVVVKVNDRVENARIWVEKKDKTLTFSPY